jgi:hypothetical protein
MIFQMVKEKIICNKFVLNNNNYKYLIGKFSSYFSLFNLVSIIWIYIYIYIYIDMPPWQDGPLIYIICFSSCQNFIS